MALVSMCSFLNHVWRASNHITSRASMLSYVSRLISSLSCLGSICTGIVFTQVPIHSVLLFDAELCSCPLQLWRWSPCAQREAPSLNLCQLLDSNATIQRQLSLATVSAREGLSAQASSTVMVSSPIKLLLRAPKHELHGFLAVVAQSSALLSSQPSGTTKPAAISSATSEGSIGSVSTLPQQREKTK